MRRNIAFLLCLVFLILFGCQITKIENYNVQIQLSHNELGNDDKESEIGHKEAEGGSKEASLKNAYFYNESQVFLIADAEYIDYGVPSYATKSVNIKVYKVKNYENGVLYRFSVDPVGSLTVERLNIYFYVMNAKIYRLWSYVNAGDKIISFYDDDDTLLKVLDTEKKLIANGYIVFQEEEYSLFETNVQDENDEHESPLHGSHYSVRKNVKQTT